MKLNRITICSYIFLTSLVASFALSAEETSALVVGKEGKNFYVKKLFRKGQDFYENFTVKQDQMITTKTAVSSNIELQLIPEFSQKKQMIADFNSYNSNDFVELSFEMLDFPENADSLYILNRLVNIKTMTGILYFSTSKQKMTTYIKSCYAVDAIKSKKEVPTPQFSSLPKEPVQLIIRQADNRFAPTWYAVTIYVTGEGAIRMTMENVTPIYVQFIFYFKALDTGKVRHEILIMPSDVSTGKKARIYALSQIHNNRKSVLGRKLDLGNSFNRRMSSIQGWISDQIFKG